MSAPYRGFYAGPRWNPMGASCPSMRAPASSSRSAACCQLALSLTNTDR